jgi:nucleoside-diphosphate-sugar epimerase
MGLALKYCTIMPLIGGGNALLQPIFVQDVVDAFLLAMDAKKTCGQIYNIAGNTQVSFRDWIATIAAALDVSPSRRSLSKRVAWILGHLMELKERILGGTILLTRFRVECLTNDMIYDISKAKQELKFTPQVGIDEGIQRTVAWYKRQNQT